MSTREFSRNQTVRIVLACLLPLPVALFQWIYWEQIQPAAWFLFCPVIFFAVLLGGLWGGLGATFLSALLVWYLFLPPLFSFAVSELRSPLSAAVFLGTGIAVSIVVARVRRRDERFRALFEMAGDGIAYVDSTGRCLDANARCCQMLGRSRNEIVGADVSEMIVGITPEFSAMVSAQMAGSGRATFERQLRHKDGSLLPVEVTLAPIDSRENVAIVHDISGRKSAEEQLRQSQEKATRLFQLSPTPMAVSDLKSGRLIDVNAAYSELVGYAWEELIGHTTVELGIVAADARTSMLYQSADDRVRHAELVVTRKSGATRPCMVAADIVTLPDDRYLLAALTDLTEANRLHEQVDRLAAIVESSQDAIASTDFDGSITSWNHGAEMVFGLSATDAIGKSVFQVLPHHPRGAVARIIERVRHGETVNMADVTWPAPAGRSVALAITVGPIMSHTGEIAGIAVVGRDVTERKNAETALQESERKYHDLWDHSPDMYFVGQPTEHRIVDCNLTLARSLGYSREEIIGGPSDKILDPAAFARISKALPQYAQAGAFQDFEVQLRRRDGTLLDALTSGVYTVGPTGSPRLVQVTMHDITDRLQAEQEIREALQQIRLATDAADIGIWKWNFADDNPEWDERIYRLYAVPPAERGLAQEIWRARLHPDDLAYTEATLAEARRTGSDWDSTFRIVLPDGRMRYIYSAAVVERDRAGEPVRMIGINRDVTDQRLYDQVLQDANATLEQRVAERTAQLQETAAELTRANAGKDAFMAAISHELRTPITGILGMAEALELGIQGSLTEHQLRYVGLIQSSGQRLLDLVNGVLLYTSLMGGKVPVQRETCRLADLCAVSIRAYQAKAAKKGQVIAVDVQPEELTIVSDSSLITRTLHLLLDNAIKFTPQDGALGIQAVRVPDGGAVQLVVWDKGIGIEPEQLPYLFDPFTQVDQTLSRRYEGVGIGLASVRKLVDLLGGAVSVESQPGSGSRFTVTLPA